METGRKERYCWESTRRENQLVALLIRRKILPSCVWMALSREISWNIKRIEPNDGFMKVEGCYWSPVGKKINRNRGPSLLVSDCVPESHGDSGGNIIVELIFWSVWELKCQEFHQRYRPLLSVGLTQSRVASTSCDRVRERKWLLWKRTQDRWCDIVTFGTWWMLKSPWAKIHRSNTWLW